MQTAALHGLPSAPQAAPRVQTCLRRLFSDRSRSRSRLSMVVAASSSNGAAGCEFPLHALPCFLSAALEPNRQAISDQHEDTSPCTTLASKGCRAASRTPAPQVCT